MCIRDSPYDEAELVPRGRYREFFVPSPEVERSTLARSAVVSGSLGAGKTMLLRTLAEQQGESGLAIKVNLVSTLQDRITPTTPVRMVDRAGAPTDVGRLVQRKSAALIALRMAVKVRKEAVPIAETINSMLPPTHRILHLSLIHI